MNSNPLAVSIAEAARRVGIGRTMFYELLHSGDGPPTVKIGRRRLIRVADLEAWMASLPELGGAA